MRENRLQMGNCSIPAREDDMFEYFGFETLTAPEAAIYFGLGLGVLFGVLAEITRFCLRRGLVGSPAERRPALGVWLTALAFAILGTQGAVQMGWISFDDHRFLNADLPWAAILVGGALFGAGMVLTRGCVSRLTVLTGSGNLRALTVLLIFAVVAHATLKGVLAPLRTTLASLTLPLGEAASLASLAGGGGLVAVLLAGGALVYGLRSGAPSGQLALAAAIGGLAALGWVGTGFLLLDDFDPVAMESLSFTSPMSETLFWTIASTSIPAGFGTGLVGGVLVGAFASAFLAGRFQWQSFDSPRQTGRYALGASLMGVGGVLAGGCTLGAGLSGVPTLSTAALLALLAIAFGAKLTDVLLSPRSTRAALVPAE